MDSKVLYKLMILHMLDSMDGPLTNSQITDFFISSGYADYFVIEDVLDDMIHQNYLRRLELFNAIEYYITPSGKNTIGLFEQDISYSIKNDIKEYLKKNSFEITRKNSLTAVMFKHDDEYYVNLKAIDAKTTLVDIKLACISKEQAEKYCENWREASTKIYSTIIKTLEQPKDR